MQCDLITQAQAGFCQDEATSYTRKLQKEHIKRTKHLPALHPCQTAFDQSGVYLDWTLLEFLPGWYKIKFLSTNPHTKLQLQCEPMSSPQPKVQKNVRLTSPKFICETLIPYGMYFMYLFIHSIHILFTSLFKIPLNTNFIQNVTYCRPLMMKGVKDKGLLLSQVNWITIIKQKSIPFLVSCTKHVCTTKYFVFCKVVVMVLYIKHKNKKQMERRRPMNKLSHDGMLVLIWELLSMSVMFRLLVQKVQIMQFAILVIQHLFW